jgi:prepilin-type processing-associated H-X9-DG protein
LNLGATLDTRQDIEAIFDAPGYAKIFSCAAGRDRVPPRPTMLHSEIEDHILEPTDYAFNDAVFGLYEPGSRPHSTSVGRLSDVRRPAEVVLIIDNTDYTVGPNPAWAMHSATASADDQSLWAVRDAYVRNNCYFGYFNVGRPLVDPFDSHRHLGRMNIAYADGHGETITIPKVHSAEHKGDLGNANVGRDVR